MAPLVSCLCVTENRSAFMPWLLWGFDRQTYPDRELIVIDSSACPWSLRRGDVRVSSVPPGTNVPTKRNLALEQARGSFVAWFDDDDWQHPERLAILMEAMTAGHPHSTEPLALVGSCRSWFVDLYGDGCRAYDGHGSLIFNTALYRTEIARAVRFNPSCNRASDTPWLRELRQRHQSQLLRLNHDHLMLWLCHDQNISNPRAKRQFPSHLDEMRQNIAPGTWADTDVELERLRQALPPAIRSVELPRRSVVAVPDQRRRRHRQLTLTSEPPSSVTASAPPKESERTATLNRTAQTNTVSLAQLRGSVELLALCASGNLDTAKALLPHWQRQCQCSTTSTLVEVRAPAPEVAALRQAVAACTAEFLLVVRPRALFYARSCSWVAEAERLMARNPGIDLVTTHPGPPAGPLGTSRSAASNLRVVWDGRTGTYRWKRPPTAYFLARRSFVQALLERATSDHLDEVLAAAATEGKLTAVALAFKGSWALEQSRDFECEEIPWVLDMARRVEQGFVPRLQPGDGRLLTQSLVTRYASKQPNTSAA